MYILPFSNNKLINIIIYMVIFLFVNYILSFFTYLIFSKRGTAYYTFIQSILLSTIYIYVLYTSVTYINLLSFISYTSTNILLTFFINYSIKYVTI